MSNKRHGNIVTQIIGTASLGHYDQVITAYNYNNQVCHDPVRHITYWTEMRKTNPSGHWENLVHKFDHATGEDTSVVVHSSDYSDLHFHNSIGLDSSGNIYSACEIGKSGGQPHTSPIEIKMAAAGTLTFNTVSTTAGNYAYPHFVRWHGSYWGFLYRGYSNDMVSISTVGEAPYPIIYNSLTNGDCYLMASSAPDKIRFCINEATTFNYNRIFFLRSKDDYDPSEDIFNFENLAANHSHNVIDDGQIEGQELTDYYLLRTAPSGCENECSHIAVISGRELFLIHQYGTSKKAFLGYYDGGWVEKEIPQFTAANSTPYFIYPYSTSVIDVYGVFSGICKRLRTVDGGNTWYFVENLNEDYNVSYIALAVGASVEDELVLAASYLNNGTTSADVLLGIASPYSTSAVEASGSAQSRMTAEFYAEPDTD